MSNLPILISTNLMSLEAIKSFTSIRNIAALYLPHVYFTSSVNYKNRRKNKGKPISETEVTTYLFFRKL